ncbi:MAG: pectate lyase [Verrucomicrobiota bacterium]
MPPSSAALCYKLGNDRPNFGDHDKSIHDTVGQISRNRRDGYAWFTDGPEAVLKRLPRWNEMNR